MRQQLASARAFFVIISPVSGEWRISREVNVSNGLALFRLSVEAEDVHARSQRKPRLQCPHGYMR